jgi:hypothetical protein
VLVVAFSLIDGAAAVLREGGGEGLHPYQASVATTTNIDGQFDEL